MMEVSLRTAYRRSPPDRSWKDQAMKTTPPIPFAGSKLADMKSENFDTVFYPGRHGPMWDLAESTESIALLESFYISGKPIALVCHSPGVLGESAVACLVKPFSDTALLQAIRIALGIT
jgi:putative intracellular protease/amidase